MSRRKLSYRQAADALGKPERFLMVTFGGEPEYQVNGHGTVSAKAVRDLLADNPQQDLFLRPNDDGLFPGFTQTWKLLGADE